MTHQIIAPTWREAYDAALEELATGGYAGWGSARVYKCSPEACWLEDCPRDWVAEIA